MNSLTDRYIVAGRCTSVASRPPRQMLKKKKRQIRYYKFKKIYSKKSVKHQKRRLYPYIGEIHYRIDLFHRTQYFNATLHYDLRIKFKRKQCSQQKRTKKSIFRATSAPLPSKFHTLLSFSRSSCTVGPVNIDCKDHLVFAHIYNIRTL